MLLSNFMPIKLQEQATDSILGECYLALLQPRQSPKFGQSVCRVRRLPGTSMALRSRIRVQAGPGTFPVAAVWTKIMTGGRCCPWGAACLWPSRRHAGPPPPRL